MAENMIFVQKEEVVNLGNQIDSSIDQLRNYLTRIENECDNLLSYVYGNLHYEVIDSKEKLVAKGQHVVGNAMMAKSFLDERMKEYGMTEEEAYNSLEKNVNDLGTLGQTIRRNFMVSLSNTVAPWIGKRMDNGENGCVEAVTKMGASNNEFLKQELNRGVAYVPTFVDDAEASGVPVVDFYPNSLNTGDIIVYNDNSHVVMYSGQGTGYYGNSSSQMQIVQGDNYNYMGGLYPTKIIKTSGDWTP